MISDLPTKCIKRYHSDKHFSKFYLQDGGKNQLAWIWNKITSPFVYCAGNDIEFQHVRNSKFNIKIWTHDADASRMRSSMPSSLSLHSDDAIICDYLFLLISRQLVIAILSLCTRLRLSLILAISDYTGYSAKFYMHTTSIIKRLIMHRKME